MGVSTGLAAFYRHTPTIIRTGQVGTEIQIEVFTEWRALRGLGRGDMLKYQPAGLTQYVLNNVFKTPPPYPVTQDDVSTPHQRLEVKTINGHESVRDDVASSQSYTRRIGWDSSNHPASGKWTPTSPAHTVCVNGPALQTSTAKPTAFTAAC